MTITINEANSDPRLIACETNIKSIAEVVNELMRQTEALANKLETLEDYFKHSIQEILETRMDADTADRAD